MRRILSLAFFVVALFLPAVVFSQGEIPVNMYTGSPGISVPLYTLADHDLAEPISMVYDANSVQPGVVAKYGIGWNLQVGGSVSREVRGLPDDFAGVGQDTRRGWLYNVNSASTNVTNFDNSNSPVAGSCPTAAEAAIQATIQNFSGGIPNDTEPDIFSFSIDGHTGRFVFDKDRNIHLMPYQDISILPTYKVPGSNFEIIAWTIKTNDGNSYVFNENSTETRWLTKTGPTKAPYFDEYALSFFQMEYVQYNWRTIYTTEWMIKKSTSFTGASLAYAYTQEDTLLVSDKTIHLNNVSYVQGNFSTPIYDFALWKDSTSVSVKVISSVKTSTGLRADITYKGMTLYDSIRGSSSFKSFVFQNYGGFLGRITEMNGSCNQAPPYQFYYNNPDNFPQDGQCSVDFWGYYNNPNFTSTPYGQAPPIYIYPDLPASERYRIHPISSFVYSGTQIQLPGSLSRNTSPTAIITGVLNRLVYPTGGEAKFVFEPHTYYDATAQCDQFGGGLRIRSIVYYDGVNPAATISKTFTYTTSGHSAGKLISRPSYAVPAWQFVVPTFGVDPGWTTSYATLVGQGTSALYNGVIAIASEDISNMERTQGSAVGYTHVEVARDGSGKVAFDYYVPATYGDLTTGSSPTDWNLAVTKFARPSTGCPPMNIISATEYYGDPSIPLTNYDHERGLVYNKSEYNNAGILVRSTATTYQYLFASGTTPVNVYGLAYDLYANSAANIYRYGKYSLLTDVAKVVATETVTTVDENSGTRKGSQSSQYTYAASNKSLISSVTNTAIDGTIFKNYYQYPEDFYVAIVPSDSALLAIKQLQYAGRRRLVIEQRSTYKLVGGSELTVGASVNQYATFSNRQFVKYVFRFRPIVSVTNFRPAIDSANIFVKDKRYEKLQTFDVYDEYGIPAASVGEDRTINSILLGYKKRFPIAKLTGTRPPNVAFSDFETVSGREFSVANGFYGTGRTGANGVNPYATLSSTITKPSGTSNYNLTLWVKNTAGTAVTLQVRIKNTALVLQSSTNYTFTPTGSDFQRFTQQIAVSTLPATFIIEIQGQSITMPSGSSPSLLPLLDDVGFYPATSLMSTSTYDVPFGMNSSTDETGVSSYSAFDPLGRTLWLADQDHNIRKHFIYNYTGQVTPGIVSSFTYYTTGLVSNGINLTGVPVNFLADQNSCVPGAVYQWDYGNGTFVTGTYQGVPQSYPAGVHTIRLQVSAPGYDTKISSETIQVIDPPYSVLITATGVKELSATNIILQTYSDFVNTFGPNTVSFNSSVTPIPGAAATSNYKYQWEKRDPATGIWTKAWSTVSHYSDIPVTTATSSFDMRCVVTGLIGPDPDDLIGLYSNVISVTIDH